MKDSYDFSKGVKNPYTDKLKDGYTVTVHYDFNKGDNEKEETKDSSGNDRSRNHA